MSYHRPHTGDPEEDRRLIREDFALFAPRILERRDEQYFLVWLDKIRCIDREMTVAYIREHAAELPENRLKLAALAMHELRELLPGRSRKTDA